MLQLTAENTGFIGRLFRLLRFVALPIERNALFAATMFLLGFACCQLEVSDAVKWARPYEYAASELFFDVYIICVVLTLLPAAVRRWVRLVLAVLFYAVSLVDVFCFVRFDSPLTPTMLMLAGETTGREATEFLYSFLRLDLLASAVGVVLLLAALHLVACVALRHIRLRVPLALSAVAGALVVVLMAVVAPQVVPRRLSLCRILAADSVAMLERRLNEPQHAEPYVPPLRLAVAWRANSLAQQQLATLIQANSRPAVDSCSFRSPHIVLIIGESYNRSHSQLYGYARPTTPRQLQRAEAGEMAVFTDAVAPWNLTSIVFRYLLSMRGLSDVGDWSDVPMFPALFRQAGYRTAFVTNQFVARPTEKLFDFSGGFFLNNTTLSRLLFDTRNDHLHRYDGGLLACADSLSVFTDSVPSLTIVHLMGSHMNYYQRYPYGQRMKLRQGHYAARQDLSRDERTILAHYDNSLIYNDSVVDRLLSRLEDRDAIALYVADHGEEVFDDSLHHWGRRHPARIDSVMAHAEFEVPMWIWASPTYRQQRPELWRTIQSCRHRPLMTDNLAHALLFLAGISSPCFDSTHCVLSTAYDSLMPRLLRGEMEAPRAAKIREIRCKKY